MTAKAPAVVKSTTELDLEARQAKDYVSPIAKAKTVGPNESLVNEDGFVGVSPEYANNANESDAPLAADSGVDKVLEDKFLGTPEAPADEKKDDEKKDDGGKHAAPAASPAPTA